MKGSEAQKQRPCKLLWMLWFDEKSISKVHTIFRRSSLYYVTLMSTTSLFKLCKKILCCNRKGLKVWFRMGLDFRHYICGFAPLPTHRYFNFRKTLNFGIYWPQPQYLVNITKLLPKVILESTILHKILR